METIEQIAREMCIRDRLSTGEWIAISATPHADSYLFALGKIEIKELESTHNSTFSRGVFDISHVFIVNHSSSPPLSTQILQLMG